MYPPPPASQLRPARRRSGMGSVYFCVLGSPYFLPLSLSFFFLLLLIVFKSSLSAFPCINGSDSSHLEARDESRHFYKSLLQFSVYWAYPTLSMHNYDGGFRHSWLC